MDERRNFYGCIPAVDIAAGIGFCNADLLAISDCLVEAVSMFHAGEDHVGGGIQHALDRAGVRRAGSPEIARKPGTIHHRGFEEKATPFLAARVLRSR